MNSGVDTQEAAAYDICISKSFNAIPIQSDLIERLQKVTFLILKEEGAVNLDDGILGPEEGVPTDQS